MNKYILVGDIGGTNLSIALIKADAFENINKIKLEKINKKVYSSHTIEKLEYAIIDFLKEFSLKKDDIEGACFAVAGPIKDNTCKMTNAPLVINGFDIEKEFEIKTTIINDFSAICYSLAVTDIENKEKVTKVLHEDGSFPVIEKKDVEVRVVIGAGTGLGVGYLIKLEIDNNTYFRALPGEGGHADFPAYNKDLHKIKLYIQRQIGDIPGNELFLSGIGLRNIYNYFINEKQDLTDQDKEDLNSIKDCDDIAKEISLKALSGTHIFNIIMEYFVIIYARIAMNISLSNLPYNGLFLAGGIVGKNEELFLRNNLFINTYLKNYNQNMSVVLNNIPIFILKDYDTSLFGCAFAYCNLNKINFD